MSNTCVGGVTNLCVAPSSSVKSESCKAPSGVTPLKMCQGVPGPLRQGQRLHQRHRRHLRAPDLPAVVAKRVLKKVVEQNYNVVNFGLMTFWQSGYFPYFAQGSDSTSQAITVFFSRDRLMDAGCYDGASLPQSKCTVEGVLYTIRQTANSRYLVHKDATRSGYTDQDFCGEFCAVKPGYGTGQFTGAYYQTYAGTGGSPGARLLQSTYQGKNLTVAGKPYVYYDSNPAYYNGGLRPDSTPGFGFPTTPARPRPAAPSAEAAGTPSWRPSSTSPGTATRRGTTPSPSARG